MRIVVWLAEGTWEACVDAARALAPEDAQFTLLHVLDPEMGDALRAAQLGLLGRTRSGPDPAAAVDDAAAAAQQALLTEAAQRVGRPADREARRGRAEQEVVTACEGAALLIMARDGDRTSLGPRSLGRASRFVLDHAPCQVLLVWPEEPPGTATMPHHPKPPRGRRHEPPGPHGGPHHREGPHHTGGPHGPGEPG